MVADQCHCFVATWMGDLSWPHEHPHWAWLRKASGCFHKAASSLRSKLNLLRDHTDGPGSAGCPPRTPRLMFECWEAEGQLRKALEKVV
jgi:hypothetical protein